MCGRFSLVTDTSKLLAYYGLVNAERFAGPRFNIAPTQPVAAVVAIDGERHLEYFRWGLIPSWAKDKKIAYSTINARAETVMTKPAFCHAFRHRRCLIPADGFYEWQTHGGKKLAWRIEPKDKGEFFSFAGVWEIWEGEDEVIRSCTIIVCGANNLLEPIHDRMPVILLRDCWSAWLDPNTPVETLSDMLLPSPDDDMRLFRVGSHVNNPNNDDPASLQPQL